VTTPEAPEFPLVLREPDGTERFVVWQSVTGEAPSEGDEITVEGEPWTVVEPRDELFVCERGLTPT
jgi:hypothetical protein